MHKSLDGLLARYAGYAILFLFCAYALFLVRGVLPIFGVALLLAYAFEPMLRRFEKADYTRGIAVAFIAMLFALVIALLVALLASAWQQVQALAENFPLYQGQVVHFIENNTFRIQKLPVSESVKQSALQAINDFQYRVPGMVGARLQSGVGWIFASLGSIGIALIIVPILTLYFMLEMDTLRGRALMIVPKEYRRDVIEIAESINELLGRYVRGQLIVCGTFGVLCMIAFNILSWRYGMSYPIVLGLLASAIYIVPYIGVLAVAAAAAGTAYFTATTSPLTCAIIAVVCVIIFNLSIDYGVAPRVLGRGVGLHPLLVIFALLSGAQIGGIFGMVLAVPVFASLRVILIYLFPQLTAPIENLHSRPQTGEIARATDDAEQHAPSRAGVFTWLRRGRREDAPADETPVAVVETAPEIPQEIP